MACHFLCSSPVAFFSSFLSPCTPSAPWPFLILSLGLLLPFFSDAPPYLYFFFSPLTNFSKPANTAGSTGVSLTPCRIDSLHEMGVVQIAAAKYHSAAVTADGKLLTWGFGHGGRLGHPEHYIHSGERAVITPQQVTSLGRKQVLPGSRIPTSFPPLSFRPLLSSPCSIPSPPPHHPAPSRIASPPHRSPWWQWPSTTASSRPCKGRYSHGAATATGSWATPAQRARQSPPQHLTTTLPSPCNVHHEAPAPAQATPRLVSSLRAYQAVGICAAAQHSAAVTSGGVLFTWGDNTYGQLGHIAGEGSSFHVPRMVDALKGKRLCQVS